MTITKYGEEKLVEVEHPVYNDANIVVIPKYKYRLILSPELHIDLVDRPNWWHRLLHRICLGWKWVELK